jgi:eukaryotic-like serine/threonine-protein kinase
MMQAGTRLGPYEILQPIGAGGMGEVYRARDTRLDRIVAIKLLSEASVASADRRERFAREARAVSSLTHPHICALYDVGSQDGVEYLVMEYLEGPTLEARLLSGPLGPEEAIRHATEIAGALAHAHGRGVIHRDLKPSNVVLTASGVKLVDFGLAKLREVAAGDGSLAATLSLTGEHRIVGTLCYMAPEQVEGGPVDARSDIFAFGAVLYEMLSGRRAFHGATSSAVVAAILTGQPPAVSTTRPALEAFLEVDHLIGRCLAKRPDERWQSARDLAAELKWLASGESPETRAHRRAAWSARTRIRAVLAAALALVAVALLAIALTSVFPKSAPPRPSLIRFGVEPPPGSTFSRSGGFMALSPDGQRIAFVATPPGGKPLLWVRPLDREAAYSLPGTEGASQPFWSPDSRFLAFTAGARLKRVDSAGGEPVTICDAPFALAGAWNGDGLIVTNLILADGLYQVSANGGAPAPATRLDRSRGERAHGWPAFLPDQRHLLFEILSDRPEYSGVFMGSLDSGERVRLVDAPSNAAFVEPGYLLYTRGGILLAQRFDAARRQMLGDAIPLVDGVAHNTLTGRSAFSVSDVGVLAYMAARRSELRFVDRHGVAVKTLGEPGSYLDPALSPDGTRVAAARLDATTGSSSIWLIDTRRGVGLRLTDPPSDNTAPVWSPDGRSIVFEANRTGLVSVCRKGPNPGDREETLFSSPYSITPTAWTPDGHAVLCEAFEKRGEGQLSVLGWKGRDAPTVHPWSAGGRGRLSPDGRWVAYVSGETGTDEVYLRPFVAGESKWLLSTQGGIEPTWRGDGREIFYLAPDGTMMAVDVRLGAGVEIKAPVRLFATQLSGSRARVAGRNQYDVSKDGQHFLLNQPVASDSITVLVNWTALLPR